MKTYTRTITFFKEVHITAKNAKAANEQLDEIVSNVEFSGEVEVDDCTNFQDEPITCPKCEGYGQYPDDQECAFCKGEGDYTPEEYHDDESNYVN